jgi:hypothetical protein
MLELFHVPLDFMMCHQADILLARQDMSMAMGRVRSERGSEVK